MKKQSLLGESLKVAFSKQAILFVVICSAVTMVCSFLPILSIVSLVFSILFGCYSYNLSLQKALQKHFPNVEDPSIITMSPTYGKKPPVMWCWSLLYGLGLFAIIVVVMLVGGMLASNLEGGASVVAMIAMLILVVIACVVYTWFVFYPQVLGTTLGGDKEFKKDFISKLDKKYYLVILLGGVVIALVGGILLACLAGNTFTALMMLAASGKVSSTVIMMYISQLLTSMAIVVVIVSLIAGIVNIAAYYYAYASWLNDADLKEVASVFGITTSSAPSNTTETPVVENMNTHQETPVSAPATQSVASEPVEKPIAQEVNNTLDELINTPQTTPQPFSEPVKTPTETPVNSSVFQNQYQETPVDNSIRQVEPPKTIKINLNANK